MHYSLVTTRCKRREFESLPIRLFNTCFFNFYKFFLSFILNFRLFSGDFRVYFGLLPKSGTTPKNPRFFRVFWKSPHLGVTLTLRRPKVTLFQKNLPFFSKKVEKNPNFLYIFTRFWVASTLASSQNRVKIYNTSPSLIQQQPDRYWPDFKLTIPQLSSFLSS